ncbi:MAG: Nramp family divalent metal transporter [Flavobacteriaceae bacterium]|tara:strand:+ start:324 stop:1514 length:1191 start_codon:yes stop_codon:yes gene_type:complete
MIGKFLFNPAFVVTAAFIGPGTITMCILTGTNYGFDLLWAVLCSTLITIFIQNIAARVSFYSKKGLATTILDNEKNRLLKILLMCLIFSSIFIGNSAYEAGNLSGTLIGTNGILNLLSIDLSNFIQLIIICLIISILIFINNYKILSNILMLIVGFMSLSFLISSIITKPDFIEILKGLFIPSFNSNNILNIVGIVGTTVVPYNLFLHAALVNKKYNDINSIKVDTIIAVTIGGVISLCIIVTSASIQGANITNPSEIGNLLEPLYGKISNWIINLGFFCAGLTSSITAPIAAAIIFCECFNLKLNGFYYKLVSISIVLIGFVFSSIFKLPIQIILFAQVANGILLPVLGVLLFVLINKKTTESSKKIDYDKIILLLIELFFILLCVSSILKIFNV